MARGVDYYELLGLRRDASAEEVKRRYRELVRAHHPDVADDPEAAHEQFISIVEAYRTLSDPVRRRAYDALSAVAPRPPDRDLKQQRQIDDWFRHAVHQQEEGDLAAAAAQCRKILALDSRHAAAHALLGDVLVAQEAWDQALVHYSSAVALAPRNRVYARKLRSTAESGQRAREAEERLQRAAQARRRAMEALDARHTFAPYAAIIVLGWVATLLFWIGRHPGQAPLGPLSVNLVVAALGLGLMLGLALGLSGPREDQPSLRHRVLGSALVVASLLLGPFVGGAAYALWGLARGHLRRSLVWAFGLAIVATASLAALVTAAGRPELWRWTLALSGHLILPSLLIGQAFGRWSQRVRGG